jgi:hypothetical protein
MAEKLNEDSVGGAAFIIHCVPCIGAAEPLNKIQDTDWIRIQLIWIFLNIEKI